MKACLAKAMEAFDYDGTQQRTRSIADPRPLSRHRRRRLYPYVRHGAVTPPRADGLQPRRLGKRPCQRGFGRAGHDLLGIDEPGPRPCHVTGADRRRRAAGADRGHRRGAGRHKAGPGRSRHLQLAFDGGRRLRRSCLLGSRHREGEEDCRRHARGRRRRCVLPGRQVQLSPAPTSRL